MIRESLQSIALQELVALAREEGYEVDGAADRAALTEFILENLRERAREKEQENSPSVQVEESKFQITETEAAGSAGPDSFPVADRYNQTRIVFMVRDPHWAFAYWDLEDKWREKLPVKDQPHYLVLRVRELGDQDSADGEGKSFFDIPIQLGDASWYIYLPDQDCRYILELAVVVKGKHTCLARSNPIRTPRDFSLAGPEVLSQYGTLYPAGDSEAIPQRILAARGD